MEIEIEAEAFADFFKKAAFNLAKNLEIPGFRKNKAPFDLLLKKLDKNQVLYEAANLTIEKSLQEAIKENELEIISQPKIEILKLALNNSLIFKARFVTLPAVALPDYQRIASQEGYQLEEVKEIQVEEALTWLQKSKPNFKETNRPARKEDFVEIEFSSPQIDNQQIQEDAFILGKGRLAAGFEDQLEGMKAGEEKQFSLTFEKEFPQKNLAGKKVDFKVKMKAVKQVILAEINDDFAKGLGEFQDLKALKESVRKGLEEEQKIAAGRRWRENVLKKISQKFQAEIPSILIDSEKQRLLANLKQRVLQETNLNFEEYLKKIDKTETELLASFLSQAEEGIKRFLILREIAKKEKIEAGEAEIQAETEKILKYYANLDQAQANIDPEKLRSYTEETIINEKTLARLEEFVNKQQMTKSK